MRSQRALVAASVLALSGAAIALANASAFTAGGHAGGQTGSQPAAPATPAAPKAPAAPTAPAAPAPAPRTDVVGLRTGDKAPDITIVDRQGKTVALKDLYKDKPLVVVFYRGKWCPYCVGELKRYQNALKTFTDGGARVIAISPESPAVLDETRTGAGIEFGLFSDEDFDAARGFKVFTEGSKVPHPGTFVIDTDGTIIFAEAHVDYRKRPDLGKVREAMQADAAPGTPAPAAGTPAPAAPTPAPAPAPAPAGR